MQFPKDRTEDLLVVQAQDLKKRHTSDTLVSRIRGMYGDASSDEAIIEHCLVAAYEAARVRRTQLGLIVPQGRRPASRRAFTLGVTSMPSRIPFCQPRQGVLSIPDNMLSQHMHIHSGRGAEEGVIDFVLGLVESMLVRGGRTFFIDGKPESSELSRGMLKAVANRFKTTATLQNANEFDALIKWQPNDRRVTAPNPVVVTGELARATAPGGTCLPLQLIAGSLLGRSEDNPIPMSPITVVTIGIGPIKDRMGLTSMLRAFGGCMLTLTEDGDELDPVAEVDARWKVTIDVPDLDGSGTGNTYLGCISQDVEFANQGPPMHFRVIRPPTPR